MDSGQTLQCVAKFTRQHRDDHDSIRHPMLEGEACIAMGNWFDVCAYVLVHHDHKAAFRMGSHHRLDSSGRSLVLTNPTKSRQFGRGSNKRIG